MKLLVSHPTLNQFSKNLVIGLLKNKMFYKLYTSIAIFPGQLLYKLSDFPRFKDLKRRSLDASWETFTHSKSFFGFGFLLASKLHLNFLLKHETGFFCIDKVYQKHDKWIANNLVKAKKEGLTAVYAYEDGALETFKAAKKLGLECIYDLPIAYHLLLQELLHKEAIRKPSWALTLGGGINDSKAKLERKREELELADTIVVPSDFVRQSLPDWATEKKIIQSPFGTPNSSMQFDLEDKSLNNKKLRILFAGSMTQRKGLGDLFDAMQLVDSSKVELVVLGSLAAPLSFYKDQVDFKYEPTRSHDKVLELMRSCDVFCLPSIVEGRALVIQEAMSQGLPIIITANTGAEDLIETEDTGFLVPIRSPEAIAEKINWFINNRSKIFQMGKNAKQLADTYSWDSYAATIYNGLNSNGN